MAVVENLSDIPGDFNVQVYSVDQNGARYGSGPIEGAEVQQITWVLNQPGSATVLFDPLADNADQVKLEQREMQIWFDDDLAWWGIPWRDSGDLNQVTVGCDGLLSWFQHRFVDRTSLLYTSIDQLSIAWNLLTYAQNESVDPYRDLNIDAAAYAPSGTIRSRNYLRSDHAAIFDLLQEFPTLSDGFDFDIVTTSSGQRLWTPYYPKKGTTKSNLKIIITEDRMRNADTVTFQSDATSILTDTYVTGGTSGDVRFEAHVQDLAAMALFRDMQGVITDGNQMDVTWLQEKGEYELGLRNHAIRSPSISVPKEMFGLVSVGDSIPVSIDYGYWQLPEADFRIGQIDWTPETLSLTFESLVAV